MKLRLLTVLAVLIVGVFANSASADNYHPQAQAKWRLAVATWTKQARAVGRKTSCGRAFGIFPQCMFGPAGSFDGWNGSTSMIRVSPTIDLPCIWRVTVDRSPNHFRAGAYSKVAVDICKPGWLSLLPHPS